MNKATFIIILSALLPFMAQAKCTGSIRDYATSNSTYFDLKLTSDKDGKREYLTEFGNFIIGAKIIKDQAHITVHEMGSDFYSQNSSSYSSGILSEKESVSILIDKKTVNRDQSVSIFSGFTLIVGCHK